MTILIGFLATKIVGFLLMLFYEGRVSSGVYEVKRSLTPLGWAVVIIFPVALIIGMIYLIPKILKKPKLK